LRISKCSASRYRKCEAALLAPSVCRVPISFSRSSLFLLTVSAGRCVAARRLVWVRFVRRLSVRRFESVTTPYAVSTLAVFAPLQSLRIGPVILSTGLLILSFDAVALSLSLASRVDPTTIPLWKRSEAYSTVVPKTEIWKRRTNM